MPFHYSNNKFVVGDKVSVIDTEDTRNNSNYAYYIGIEGDVTNPAAGASRSESRVKEIVEVDFNGNRVTMYWWRLYLVLPTDPTWEL